jgi:hypothetical protein
MFSGILFLATILVDWANDNFAFISSQESPLLPIEVIIFAYGVILLAFGLLANERLRRITTEENDIDPPPLEASIFVGFCLAVDVFFLWIIISQFNNLTPFGKALFVSSVFPLIGAPIAVLTWEKKSLIRNIGIILLLAPFFLIFAWLILSAIGIL